MSDAADLNWRVIAEAVARQAKKDTGLEFGNVSFRIDNGRPSGLIEIRRTIKFEQE